MNRTCDYSGPEHSALAHRVSSTEHHSWWRRPSIRAAFIPPGSSSSAQRGQAPRGSRSPARSSGDCGLSRAMGCPLPPTNRGGLRWSDPRTPATCCPTWLPPRPPLQAEFCLLWVIEHETHSGLPATKVRLSRGTNIVGQRKPGFRQTVMRVVSPEEPLRSRCSILGPHVQAAAGRQGPAGLQGCQ